MTHVHYWDYLPQFRPKPAVECSLQKIEQAEREIREIVSHKRRVISEAYEQIDRCVSADYSTDEIRTAKVKADSSKFCPCGTEISPEFQHCQTCGRQLFPF